MPSNSLVAKPLTVVMAPAVGSTEMRYCGISLFRSVDSVTIALWPAVPTGGVPQRISLGCCCAEAAQTVTPSAKATAIPVQTRLIHGISLLLAFPPRRIGVRRCHCLVSPPPGDIEQSAN